MTIGVNRNWLWIPGVLLLMWLTWYFSGIVGYVMIAWVLSLLGRPVMAFLLKRIRIGRFRLNNALAALMTILFFYGVLAGLGWTFIPTIVNQAQYLSAVDYNAIGEKWRGPFANLDAQLRQLGLIEWNESVVTFVQSSLVDFFQPARVGDLLGSVLSAMGSLLAALFAITFILFFFLKEGRLFFSMINAVAPERLAPKISHAIDDSSNALTRYFGGLLAQMTVFTTVLFVLLSLLGIKNALLIAFVGGVFNIIPYIGPLLGGLFGAFITLSAHIEQDVSVLWPLLIKVLAAFGLTQVVDNILSQPIIFSKSVRAHPLEIFLVTLMAAKLGGVLGMILGIPVYTVMRVIAKVFFSEFRVVRQLTRRMAD